MIGYKYNDYIGSETLEKEYKLFTFHPKGIDIDIHDYKYIEELFITGKWIFNDIVLKNLEYYINYYIPKYSTGFLNKQTDILKGELYIGVTDDGIIKGIPFKGELDINKIYKNVKQILESDKIFTNTNLMDYIDIELIEVERDTNNLAKKHHKLIQKYTSNKIIYENKLQKYKKNISRWRKLIRYSASKLHLMLNDNITRKELIEYIQKHDKKQYKIIELLKTTYQFEKTTGEAINKLKENKNNVWYWICKWKDEKLEFIKTIKPIPPSQQSNKIYPLNILITIIDMIPTWINKENINLYLIKFIFKKPSKGLDIYYKNNDGKLITCYRNTCIHNGPSCVPF